MKKIAQFFNSVQKEMTKVRWPNKKEMVTYSIATISFIAIFTLFFIGTDTVLGMLVKVFG
jgi:preprotein translocase, SecE subunit, bacterial